MYPDFSFQPVQQFTHLDTFDEDLYDPQGYCYAVKYFGKPTFHFFAPEPWTKDEFKSDYLLQDVIEPPF